MLTVVAVRQHLVELQRREAAASQGNIVTEGRDQGTVAFPDAQCKIFLTAAPEVRARRRWKEILTRDRVSAVFKLTQTGAEPRMKFGNERGLGKQSVPGRPVL